MLSTAGGYRRGGNLWSGRRIPGTSGRSRPEKRIIEEEFLLVIRGLFSLILYVSGLDGTLAGPDERLSKETVQIINTLVDNGLAFTIATARSLTSAAEMIAPLHLRLPVVY